jgi:hypothetical protein
MNRSRKRTIQALAVAAVVTAGTPLMVAPARAGGAGVGAANLGDRLFPDLGNGGYDAQSYEVAFDYQRGSLTMASTVTMRAVATQRPDHVRLPHRPPDPHRRRAGRGRRLHPNRSAGPSWASAAQLCPGERGFEPLDQAMKEVYQVDAAQRPTAGPPARLKTALGVLFDTNTGGALTLYALRDLVGQPAFERIERTFFSTYRDRSATTRDYITVAERVTGRDLTGFFDSWLYAPSTPPMPGHPDWSGTQRPNRR